MPRPHAGEAASRAIRRIFPQAQAPVQRYTDRVEAASIDESYLDVTDCRALFGSGEEIANALRKSAREELGLTISVGVSFNKTFAKLGSDYKKPDATTVLSRENFRQILYPLPAGTMLGVGGSAEAALKRIGIHTMGDIAAVPRETLVNCWANSAARCGMA